MSFVVWIVVSVAMVLVQGMILQTATAMAGEQPPNYLRALTTALFGGAMGGLATFAFRWTIGWITWMFLGSTLTWVAGIGLGFAVTAGIYRSRLEIPTVSALKVAAIHNGLAWAIGALIWGAYSYF